MKKKELIGKILLSIGTIILSMILLPLSVVSAKVIPNDKTGIPDKNLYQAILFELDKKSDKKITDDDLEEVYSIGDYFVFTSEKNENKKVKNLKGLEKFDNLRRLDIPIRGQASLKGIDKIPNLKYLTIRNGKLKNLNVLKKLPKLERLNLQNVNLKDWTALGQLKGLTTLEINKCNLRSFRQVKKLTKLDNLIIEGTKLKNLKGINKLTELTGLYISTNRLTSISGVEKLTKLMDLDVSDNKLTKLPSLKKLKGLVYEHTSFAGNKISEKELRKKLPSKAPNSTINYWAFTQNTKKKLKVYNVENINVNTTKITGVTEKQVRNVVLMTDEGVEIKTVKSNKQGKFSFEELDLSAYEGKKLKIVILRIYYDAIKDEGGFETLKTVKFMVQEK